MTTLIDRDTGPFSSPPTNEVEARRGVPAQVRWTLAAKALEAFDVGFSSVGWEAHIKFVDSPKLHETKSKEETYAEALGEQKELGITFLGFEHDEDLKDLPARLVDVFGEETLDRCLVEKIVYDPDHVLVAADGGAHYEVPNEQYLALLSDHPDIDEHRVRAINTAKMSAISAVKPHQRMPIALYSFVGEPLDTKDYLPQDADDGTKMKLYKQGTVVHEVAHSAYEYLLDDERQAAWDDLSQHQSPLTTYAAKYDGKSAQVEEQFAEAVRLYATNKAYLEKKSPEIAHFIELSIPSLRADGLIAL